jgi:hypothetical protein
MRSVCQPPSSIAIRMNVRRLAPARIARALAREPDFIVARLKAGTTA